MKSALVGACVAAFVFIGVLLGLANLNEDKVNYDAIKQTVSFYSDGAISAGTGFGISKNLVLTAGHNCVDKERGVPVAIFYDSLEAKIVKVDPKLDLCLLAIERPIEFLRIAQKAPGVRSPIAILGHPLGVSLQVPTYGAYVGDMMIAKAPRSLFSCPSFHGNSGGPILNGRGEVIGVVVEIAEPYPQLTFGTRLEDTWGFVMEALDG